tara:strand:+ start:326 stop:520 length:195 start_codon:yes stop_codon:yes gene_type:complete
MTGIDSMRTRKFFKKLYGETVWENLKLWQKVIFVLTFPLDVISILVVLFILLAFIMDTFFGMYI